MIRVWKRHPGFFALSRYVDRGEDSADLGRIRTHLRDCPRCRDEVAWVHRLRGESRRLVDLEPPAGTLDNILARRADGERLILPVDALPTGRTRGPARLVGAGAVVTILAIVATVSLTNRATAGSNNLSFSPKDPQPGDEIKVRYVATTALAGADSLRLRVRFREKEHLLQQREYPGDYLNLILFPDHDGVFEGRFTPPARASYMRLAVEDTHGTTVDSNNRQLWEILTYDDRGGVLYEALRQRQHAAEDESDWRRRFETSQQMTQLFPGRPEGWYRRFRYELEYSDPAERERVLESHRDAFVRLEFELESREVGPSELAAMMDYAAGLGDSDAAAFWENRLARRDPGNRSLLRRRVFRVLVQEPDQLKALEAIEDAWLTSSPKDWNLAEVGLDIALATGQWDRAEAWARRLTDGDPRNMFTAGRQLADHGATLELGIDYLGRAAQLSEREADWMRPIGMDAIHYDRERAERLQRILTRLADALIDAGLEVEATDVLARASDLSWNPALLRELADRRLTVGDTADALDLLARAASDPLVGSEIEELAARLVASSGGGVAAWRQSVSDRRDRLRRWVLAASEFRRIRSDVTVERVDGTKATVPSLAPAEPTLVAVTAFLNGRISDARMERFAELHDRLSSRVFPFVVVTTWGDRTAFAEFVGGHRPAFPVYHDPDNVAKELFGVSRVTEYVVLDADGNLRGTFWDLDAALRLLHLLPRRSLAA